MLNLTPQNLRLVDYYEDGLNARHFEFEIDQYSPDCAPVPGQFFMLVVPGCGLAPFTYASLPDKTGRFTALIRKVGSLTDTLFNFPPGKILGYSGPYGTGWPIEKLRHAKQILIVAGGCGLAPLAAAIDHLIANGKGSAVTLIYGANDKGSQVLSIERNYWHNNITLFETLMNTSNQSHSGMPTKHVTRFLNKQSSTPDFVLTCGPEVMMRAVAELCSGLSVSPHNIWLSVERRMRCGVGLCGHCYMAESYACKNGPTYTYSQLTELDNKTAVFSPHSGAFQYC